MINRHLITAILTLLIIPLFSQSPQENLDKYWDYRERFYEKFIVDLDPLSIPQGAPKNGINLPAGIYNPTDSGERRSVVSWGDGTIYLGQYIAMLATEYGLKQKKILDLTEITQKIYRAMDALNRLDDIAEPEFGCGEFYTREYSNSGYTNINGFFIRDDVDNDFFNHWKLNGKSYWNDMVPKSDYLDSDPRIKEMSQDQVWHLLLGLALVKHYVDATDLFEDSPGDYVTLAEMAEKQAYRIITIMQTVHNVLPWTFCDDQEDCYPGEWGWTMWSVAKYRIKNPCTGIEVNQGGSSLDLSNFSPQFEDAGNWITDQNIVSPYIGGVSPPLPHSMHAYNDVGHLTLSTVANTVYGEDLSTLFTNIRKCADYYNVLVTGNPYDMKYFWLDHLPLISRLLHSETRDRPFFDYFFSHVETLLNEAPSSGPEKYENPPPDYLWSQTSMIGQPYGISSTSNRDDLWGEYNGVDYMLLFNLFHLVYDHDFRRPITIDYDLPTTYTYDANYDFAYGDEEVSIGHQDDETLLTINCKREITMNSTVHSNGKIRLRGRTIVLDPGFEVELGGVFEATSYESMQLDFTPPTN